MKSFPSLWIWRVHRAKKLKQFWLTIKIFVLKYSSIPQYTWFRVLNKSVMIQAKSVTILANKVGWKYAVYTILALSWNLMAKLFKLFLPYTAFKSTVLWGSKGTFFVNNDTFIYFINWNFLRKGLNCAFFHYFHSWKDTRN